MFTKITPASALFGILLGFAVLSPLAYAQAPYDAYEELSGTHPPNAMLMPKHMPRDKSAMVSKKDFLEAASKMWDQAASEMKLKDMKMMSMAEYKSFFDSYLKR
jgi:hypothetical protein